MKHFKGLRRLLFLHGVVTLGAAVVLCVSPGLIPAAAGIHLESSAYVVAYLLAAAEFGLSFLSFGGSRLTDPRALRLIAYTCAVFQGTSAVLEAYAASIQGANLVLLLNIVVRAVIVALFVFFAPRAAK